MKKECSTCLHNIDEDYIICDSCEDYEQYEEDKEITEGNDE